MRNFLYVSAPGHSPWILDWTCYLRSLYVMFTFPTGIFYRGVPGFATDCHCGVWCRGLTTYLLYVDLLFGNLVWNDSSFVNWQKGKNNFLCCFWLFYTLMPHNMIILYFFYLILMYQTVLYFLHSTSVLSFYIDVILTLSIWWYSGTLFTYAEDFLVQQWERQNTHTYFMHISMGILFGTNWL